MMNTTNKKRSLSRVWLAVLGIGLLALALFLFLPKGQEQSTPNVSALAAPSLGDPNAPISIVEYADFQCVFCERFARDTKPLLEKEFIETGQVRFEWRHFPVFGEDSRRAALAASCAHEQGSFWEYHDALFGIGEASEPSGKSLEALVRAAASLGLDSEDFRACVVEERHAAHVDAHFTEARNAGLTGTPTFFVNGTPLVGAHPINTWREILGVFLREMGS